MLREKGEEGQGRKSLVVKSEEEGRRRVVEEEPSSEVLLFSCAGILDENNKETSSRDTTARGDDVPIRGDLRSRIEEGNLGKRGEEGGGRERERRRSASNFVFPGDLLIWYLPFCISCSIYAIREG